VICLAVDERSDRDEYRQVLKQALVRWRAWWGTDKFRSSMVVISRDEEEMKLKILMLRKV